MKISQIYVAFSEIMNFKEYIEGLQISGTRLYNEKGCKLVVKGLQISAGGENIFCYVGSILRGHLWP